MLGLGAMCRLKPARPAPPLSRSQVDHLPGHRPFVYALIQILKASLLPCGSRIDGFPFGLPNLSCNLDQRFPVVAVLRSWVLPNTMATTGFLLTSL